MRIDKIMNYNDTINYINENGWDNFLKSLQEKYPNRELYTVSNSWYYDRQYICKAKGIYGDVIVDWE